MNGGTTSNSGAVSSDTDEEDWESIGPAFLRSRNHTANSNGQLDTTQHHQLVRKLVEEKNGKQNVGFARGSNPAANGGINEDDNEAGDAEKSAAFALVNLMSV